MTLTTCSPTSSTDLILRRQITLLNVGGKTIAHVPTNQLQRVLDFQDPRAPRLRESGSVDVICSQECDFLHADESDIQFLAYWIHNRDVYQAFNVVQPETDHWLDFFFKTYNFCAGKYPFTRALLNSLIDYLIWGLQEEAKFRSEGMETEDRKDCIKSILLDAFERYAHCPHHGHPVNLFFAILFLHHDPSFIRSDEHVWASLHEQIRKAALPFLCKAWVDKDWNLLPTDPLSEAFEAFGLYHIAEIEEISVAVTKEEQDDD